MNTNARELEQGKKAIKTRAEKEEVRDSLTEGWGTSSFQRPWFSVRLFFSARYIAA